MMVFKQIDFETEDPARSRSLFFFRISSARFLTVVFVHIIQLYSLFLSLSLSRARNYCIIVQLFLYLE